MVVWWFGGLVVWWFGGLVVWWFGGLVVQRPSHKLVMLTDS
ncbi:Mobile element protein [Rhodopirellula islandica]|uniref:Mobile element protein n=1 Tax=Rhodopirellula islandica TaxID=595434 RepID=A0A0J1EI28_RHOIS|nr:Mobile element protein [Rhodopirellula islandica]